MVSLVLPVFQWYTYDPLVLAVNFKESKEQIASSLPKLKTGSVSTVNSTVSVLTHCCKLLSITT